MQSLFSRSKPGTKGYSLPKRDVPEAPPLPDAYRRKRPANLPELAEPEVVRHFTNLSRLNYSVDSHFYPLGSCTMKYNPKFAEKIAAREEFTALHPLLPQLMGGGMLTQGALEILYNLEQSLSEICGMDAFTTHPMAGAHGELTGIMLIAAYFRNKGIKKKYVLIPDSGHGTNPASAAIAGFQVKTIPSDASGMMDMKAYKEALSGEVAAIMLTCPDTLGNFYPHIKEITDLLHEAGGLAYYDGANLNAILGKARPGDLGFDVVHVNLHKTFATPHGGGGPGAGPVGVKKELIPFLPVSRIRKREDGTFALHYDEPLSVGYMAPFYGNFLVLLRAYAYILLLGRNGLIEAGEHAVLNANYLLACLKDSYKPGAAYPLGCMHEFVVSPVKQMEHGVHAIDIAKALLDRGFYAPTVYFPLIVKEAIMIEPTETETKATLDSFIAAMRDIAELAEKNPEAFADMPVTTPVTRLDEVKAARDMDIAD
ncbi:MAG: glycine dehydrogenase subunit 2, partial [Spirochaetales bacterium]